MDKIMIKKSTINFQELVDENSDQLTLNFKSKMIDKLEHNFTEFQSRWFIANLYAFLMYHSTKDFPINIDTIYKLIGFANKGNAKRALINNFTKDEDYKILLIPRENQLFKDGKNLGGAGLNEETIMLNIDTFKSLCMIVKTDKAKEIRKYYIKLENIFNEIINEERQEYEIKQKLLENEIKIKNELIENTQKQFKLTIKKWYDQEPGDVVYAYINNSQDLQEQNLITIGKTKNIKKREGGYMTHNQNGNMVYMKRCYNCDLTEKVLHHILDKYRCERNKEWFEISEELAIYTIDMACDFLDTFINSSEKLLEYKMVEFIKELSIEKFDTSINFNQSINKPDLIYNPEIKDYKRFIRELCEKTESKTLKYDLISAYRIWCKKSLSKLQTKEFVEYIDKNFNMKEIYNQNSGIRSNCFIDLKIKPLVFLPDISYDPRLYEKFIIEECIVNYSYNIKITDFISSYTDWVKNKFSDYEFTNDDFIMIKEYFKRKLVYDNGLIYGIQLNSDKLPFTNVRECNKIHMINENKETLIIYNGLNDASLGLSLELKQISDIIRYSKVIEYETQKVTLIYEIKDNLIIPKTIKMEKVFKFNYDTKEILKTYTSRKEILIDLEITSNTILRYINVQKVFKTKKDGNINILLSRLDNIDNIVPRVPTKVVRNIKKKNKILYTYHFDTISNKCTNMLYKTFEGPSNAANELYIGNCTIYRHMKNKIPLKITQDNKIIPLIFTYTKLESTKD